MSKTMITRYLLLPTLVGAMALTACDFSLPWEPTLPAPTIETTAIPTATPTPTQNPNPFAAFANLDVILYSDLIPNPPPFQPGETPWTPDPDVYLMQIIDDGQNNYVFLCNIATGAANDGVINLADYPIGPVTTQTQCYAGAVRPSSGVPYTHVYVIRKDGDRGDVLNVSLYDGFTRALDDQAAHAASALPLMTECSGGVCIEPSAYVLEGSLGAASP